jgi:hypothetical protein
MMRTGRQTVGVRENDAEENNEPEGREKGKVGENYRMKSFAICYYGDEIKKDAKHSSRQKPN